MTAFSDPYVDDGSGVRRPPTTVVHRDEDYNVAGFSSLYAMQARHFWFQGRHRFVLHFTRRLVRRLSPAVGLRALDLGGGCGGWISYLAQRAPGLFDELALGDSSRRALDLAAAVVPPRTPRYHVDLLQVGWQSRWDVVFLLDVLEHLTADVEALRQVRGALRPGGYLLVTAPALERFRTAIDDMSHHVRRYAKRDFVRLAAQSGLELHQARYFMFFLSPLVWLARWRVPPPAGLTNEEVRRYLDRSDRIPLEPLNRLLAAVFAAETPLGAWCPFPWGTSILGLFRRPP